MTSAQAHEQPKNPRGINVAVPPELHRKLKVQAALSGQTLQATVERAINAGLNLIPASGDVSRKVGTNGAGVPVDFKA